MSALQHIMSAPRTLADPDRRLKRKVAVPGRLLLHRRVRHRMHTSMSTLAAVTQRSLLLILCKGRESEDLAALRILVQVAAIVTRIVLILVCQPFEGSALFSPFLSLLDLVQCVARTTPDTTVRRRKCDLGSEEHSSTINHRSMSRIV